jgi:5,10-methylenetetrahydrofolate reductase
MSKLFLEIVPRTEVKFSEEIHSVSHLLNRITGVNIPYTHSCQLNTISAIDTIQMITNPGLIIPHIRARDFVKVE